MRVHAAFAHVLGEFHLQTRDHRSVNNLTRACGRRAWLEEKVNASKATRTLAIVPVSEPIQLLSSVGRHLLFNLPSEGG